MKKFGKQYWFTIMGVTAMVLATLFCHGCKSTKSVTESSQNSTLISERYDSALMIAGDSANAALLFRCDSLGNVYLANLITEQGRRIRLELLLQEAINQRDSLFRALSGTNASSTAQLTNATQKQPKNTPLLLQIDCKEDSFETVVRGLRERIAYYENNKQRIEVPVQYIPDFYRNCTRGFWTLLVLIIIALALIVWKNWSSIAAWAIKIWAKFKF